MTKPSNLPDNQLAGDEDHINVLDLLIVLAKHKRLILGLPFVVAMIAAGYSLSIPNIFTGSTKILPPQSQSSASGMLAQLGGIAGLVGGGGKSINDVYIAMLKSRTVADNLIERFSLRKSSTAKYPSQVRQSLAGATTITSGKDGIITIEVDDKNPKLAADIANAYVDELLKFTQVLAVTEASQRRLFFERQFAQARDNLAKAEAVARQTLDRGGLVNVDAQGRAMTENTERLRAQISVKEVEIGAMRTFAADRNPDLQRVKQELESMKRQLAKIEGVGGTKSAISGANGQGADSLRLLRDVKYHEIIVELLAKQYELAKLDEAKDSSVVQVMDKAIEPDLRSKPNRVLIVLLSAMAAGFVAIFWAFVREAMAKGGSDPQQGARLQALKRYLAWRGTL